IAMSISATYVMMYTYSDRYVQNPATISILGTIFQQLKSKLSENATVQVGTLFKSQKTPGRRIFDDWANQADFEFFTSKWLSAMVGRVIELDVAESNRDIPHHRKLEIEFEDGRTLKVRFDQGVAYWRIRCNDIWFDFDLPVDEQVIRMAGLLDGAKVQNSERKWSTDVLVELKEGGV